MALNYLLDSVIKESKKIYIGIFNLCNFIGMSIGVALFSKLIVVFNMNICFVFLLVAVIIKACMSNSISAVNNKTTGYDYEC
jgi:DHA2 family metal-tetracycline-proton antiporter-like MFS transporter